MEIALENLFHQVGVTEPAKQRHAVKLLHAAGAFGDLPNVKGELSDSQASAILKAVSFTNEVEAKAWLKDAERGLQKSEHPSAGLPARAPSPQLMMLAPETIKVEAGTYQFRSGGDKNGVTDKGRFKTDQWDAVLHSDPLIVHERFMRDQQGKIIRNPKGASFVERLVADGHHRHDLALRSNAAGKGPGQVAALVLREADGYTAKDVKVIAAYKNIANGHTDIVDTARIFKEAKSGSVHTEWLPSLQMDKGNLQMAYNLSGLSDESLSRVAKGEVPAEMAASVARQVDEPRQDIVMKIISEKLKNGQSNPTSFVERFHNGRNETVMHK